MFDDIFGNWPQWHLHILILIERCLEIHIVDGGTAKFGIGRADNAVPHDFR
jgi:hypothetical protein